MEAVMKPPHLNKLSFIIIQGTFKLLFGPFSSSSSQVFATTCSKSGPAQYFQIYATNLVYCASLAWIYLTSAAATMIAYVCWSSMVCLNMPVFCVWYLDEYWQNHPELHDIPIYYASSLARKCMAVYQTYINAMNDKIRKAININNPFVFKHISNLKVSVTEGEEKVW